MNLLMLSRVGGQSAEWSNAALQALWASVVSPVLSVHGPPLVDLLLHQLVAAPALLPNWITKLNLVKLDVGTKAPRLVRMFMPPDFVRPNGTLKPGDVFLDAEVEVDLPDADIVVIATLETAASKLVSRLTGKVHAATVELKITKIKQACIMRLRLRPQAGCAFVGLVKFTGKPAAEVTVHAHDVSGVHLSLPVSHFPGSETITAWIVQRIFRLLMALPYRFIPVDFSPALDLLTNRMHMAAVPRGGSLRIYVMEATGLGDVQHSPVNKRRLSTAGGHDSSAQSFAHTSSSVIDVVNFDATDMDDGAPGDSHRGADGEPPSPVTATGNVVRKMGGIQPLARVAYAFGSKEVRTACTTGVADDSGHVQWAEHEGVVVVDLVGPGDAITVTLRRRKVLGPLGRLGTAHFKLYWHPDGSATVFFSQHDGTPVVVRAALPRASDTERAAAGVQFSGRDGFVDVWMPLIMDNSDDAASGATGSGQHRAAVRLQMSIDWFGGGHAMSAEETAAALVMQRWVRRWKARKRLAAARALVSHGTFLPVLQLVVTFQRALGLPLKSQYTATVHLTSVDDHVISKAPWCSATCPVVHAATHEPSFGTSVVIDLPPQGVRALMDLKPLAFIEVKRHNELVAVARVPLPAGKLTGRGDAARIVHKLEPTFMFDVLTQRAAHKAHRASTASGGSDVPSVVLYAAIVLKPAPPEAAVSGPRSGKAAPAPMAPPSMQHTVSADVADLVHQPKASVRELAAKFEETPAPLPPPPSPPRVVGSQLGSLTVIPEDEQSERPPTGEQSMRSRANAELAAARLEAAEARKAAEAAAAEAQRAMEEAQRVLEEARREEAAAHAAHEGQ